MIDELRRTRHQRDGKLGRVVRVPFHSAFPQYGRPEECGWEPHKELICTIICWIAPDHYLVALPIDNRLKQGSYLAHVPCGVCVDA